LSADHERASGERASPKRLAARTVGAALATLERHVDRMARALASVINIFDPHVIVLGGGMSNLVHVYERVPARWGDYVFCDSVRTRLVRAHHGDSSGVRGAAWLAKTAPE
jgi:fructokinase